VIGAFPNYLEYVGHLKEEHQVHVKESFFNFSCREDFESWRTSDRRDASYTLQTKSFKKTCTTAYFNCNRSDSKGFMSNCIKNISKTGGSIKLKGTCPSRIVATFLQDGSALVKFIETHVGHEMDVRAQRLTQNDQNYLLQQLQAGVSSDRILKDARNLKNGEEPSKLNLITRNDLHNLAYRKNVDKTRHSNDFVAISIKVNEWNSNGKNYAFLFKQMGETHPVLKSSDFAVAFMNGVMERRFREFGRIVCIDGTHGLSKYKGWELTTLLVKDETKAGFPVAFMVSNRKDQIMQEVFLGALKKRMDNVEGKVLTEYIMSDDDIKYHNAWIKTMGNNPKRLICAWHVIKNWNIQGRKKLKGQGMQKSMKKEMKKFLTASSIELFQKYTNEYFSQLKEENEKEFLIYLQQHYFKSQERIESWAYCYRSEVGINTNMALESLNRYIKKENLKAVGYIRLERLLDILEEVVDDKMWKRIVSFKRPHRNTYQGRAVVKAHKKAEKVKENVEEKGLGHFSVLSSSGDKYYNILYKKVCITSNCREMFCEACLVCIHKYSCECVEYLVKGITCKHVHAVAMFEKEKQKYVLDTAIEEHQEEPQEENTTIIEEIREFIQEREFQHEVDSKERKQIVIEQASHYINSMFNLDADGFKVFEKNFQEFMDRNNKDLGMTTSKRKLDKQTYFPQAKKKKGVSSNT
ncbi:hypothetical protein NQ315_008741, partial [Exocentrus adspersus]